MAFITPRSAQRDYDVIVVGSGGFVREQRPLIVAALRHGEET